MQWPKHPRKTGILSYRVKKQTTSPHSKYNEDYTQPIEERTYLNDSTKPARVANIL